MTRKSNADAVDFTTMFGEEPTGYSSRTMWFVWFGIPLVMLLLLLMLAWVEGWVIDREEAALRMLMVSRIQHAESEALDRKGSPPSPTSLRKTQLELSANSVCPDIRSP